ncbi:MAG: hypothetical protein GYA14_04930 [Ignavibacteria bacterium]|nr:hypothetical protein [Ignavibacteria bacterium]
MEQLKVSLKKEHLDFIRHHAKFGFKDKSSLIRKAVEILQEKIETESLKSSAKILSEIYTKDVEVKEWVNDSDKSWPDDN